jgi:cytochrome c peroxidase
MINTLRPLQKIYNLLWFIAVVILFAACNKQVSTTSPKPMPLAMPANFPAPVYDFINNPLTEEGFALGRKLFYDPLLSRNNTISCGSCHIQGSAFTHHGHSVSHGIDDKLGTRNSPPIMNLAWSTSFFWDGGVFNLDLQPIAPVENPVEMDETMPNVLVKLNASTEYKQLFQQAFGNSEITSANMLKALSQFMLQCVSANSKYDKYVRHEGVEFSGEEKEGLQIFREKCSGCHSTDLFTDNNFHNNGLSPKAINDSGRFRITLNPADMYLFKTPSLRNVANTPPYMHDGRFSTLEAVLNHYSSGVQNSNTLDGKLTDNGILGIPLTDDEKTKLIAFLNTLTDETFLRDKKLSEQ